MPEKIMVSTFLGYFREKGVTIKWHDGAECDLLVLSQGTVGLCKLAGARHERVADLLLLVWQRRQVRHRPPHQILRGQVGRRRELDLHLEVARPEAVAVDVGAGRVRVLGEVGAHEV